jgi:hypothetical protein
MTTNNREVVTFREGSGRGMIMTELDIARLLDVPRSRMLRNVLEDVDKAERSESVEVHMSDWHQPIHDWGQRGNPIVGCSVCLAGCAMRGIGVADDLFVTPSSFQNIRGGALTKLLNQMDDFRCGIIPYSWGGVQADDKDAMLGKLEMEHVDYDEDRAGFKAWVNKVADYLESVGC